MQHKTVRRWWVYLFLNSLLAPHLIANPKKQSPSPFRPMELWFRFLWSTSTRFHPLFRLILRLNWSKHSWEMFNRIRFWSTVSKCGGTHCTDSFFMCKCSCKMLWTRSTEIYMQCQQAHAPLIRRSLNTALWIFSMVSTVVAVFGRPECLSLNVDKRHAASQQPIF